MISGNNIKNKLQTILDLPGVYKMLDQYGNILYIGKSIALKKRIASYLGKEIKRNKKIKHMLLHLYDVEVYYTDTELDALLLECKWIKRYRPPYNTALMHPHKYGYLIVEEGPYYALRWSRTKPKKALRIVGPLTHSTLSRKAHEFYKVQYPFMCCKLEAKACIKAEFGKCKGYCSEEERINRLKFFDESLSADSKLDKKVMTQIETYSLNWDFEKAGDSYEQLKGLHYLRSMDQMIKKLSLQKAIGRIPIPNTHWYKYYLIHQGTIYKTMRGPLSEEEEIIAHLKELTHKGIVPKEPLLLKENIDEIKILYSFFERKMHHIEV